MEDHREWQPCFYCHLKKTQSSVNFAVGQVTGMMEFIAADIRVAVEEKLRTALTDTGVNLPCLDDCFNNINPFDGLMSEHMQTKFYKENFYLVVGALHTAVWGISFHFI